MGGANAVGGATLAWLCYVRNAMQLHLFDIGDIPVRVSIWYGLLLVFWFQGGADPRHSLIWVIVVTLSILVHELGHALVARYYRLRPGILLHGLGGLCHHDRAEKDRHDVFIVIAGPGAGLLLGLITWLVARFAPASVTELPWFDTIVSMSLFVNVGWSLVNLLPIWPLDGGLIYRLGMLRLFKPGRAEKVTHYTALALLAAAAVVGQAMQGPMMLMLMLWIAFANVNALRGDATAGPVRPVNKSAKPLLLDAQRAYAQQDFKEAARLGHLLRLERNVSDDIARQGLLVLGLSSARIGEHRDALNYLRGQPLTPEVVEAHIESLFALGREAELDELLASDAFAALPAARRAEILAIVRPGAAGDASQLVH